MKKIMLMGLITLAFTSSVFAETGADAKQNAASQQSQPVKQDQQQSDEKSSSVYESIETGWNKFLDFLGAKKTAN